MYLSLKEVVGVRFPAVAQKGSMYILYVFFTVSGVVVLFGSLMASLITQNINFFRYGYPISAVLLILAMIAKANVHSKKKVGCELTYLGKVWKCKEYDSKTENLVGAWKKMKKTLPEATEDVNLFLKYGGKIDYFDV